MTSPAPDSSEPAPQAASDEPRFGPIQQWMVGAFRWHLLTFLTTNIALNITNAVTGRPWWAFWPLIATGLLLAVHYLGYKTVTVDERWAEERVEELNLKSYDRGHIEDLKSRYGADKTPGDGLGARKLGDFH